MRASARGGAPTVGRLAARPGGLCGASKPSDVYEGFIFSLIVATASRHGATVTYRRLRSAGLVSPTVRDMGGWRRSVELLHFSAVATLVSL